MGKQFESMLPEHEEFIRRQHIFFVGSAPLSGDGRVNLSPKGHDSLRILNENRVAYLDLTGSGNETSAHIRENGRVTIMFCAFEGAGERDTLERWTLQKGEEGLRQYRKEKNSFSLDGLPTPLGEAL